MRSDGQVNWKLIAAVLLSIVFVSAAAVFVLGLFAGPGGIISSGTPVSAGVGPHPEKEEGYSRVVSLSPAVTEIVYALGAQDRLVGIASYSDYPPQARSEKPQVGGVLDVDIEKVVSLRPDLVITPPGAMINEKLRGVASRVEFVPNKTLDDIAASFERIGRLVGRPEEGSAMAARFRGAVDAARRRNSVRPPVSTLVVIGYEPLWVAGGYGFLNELVEAAGGVNSAGLIDKDFYGASVESIVAANPEVIVDLTLEGTAAVERRSAVTAFWSRFTSIPAVRNNRIAVIDSDFLTIPGPRLIEGLDALEKALHPPGETPVKDAEAAPPKDAQGP